MVKWEDDFKHYSIICPNELRSFETNPDWGSNWRLFFSNKTELGGHWVWAAGVEAPLCKMKLLLTERTRTAWPELHVEVVRFLASLFRACYCRTCQLWRLYSIGEASSRLLLTVYRVWWGDFAGASIDKVLLRSWIQTNAVTVWARYCWTKMQL